MLNIALLFEKNQEIAKTKLRVDKGRIIIPFSRSVIDGKGIMQLMKLINWVENAYSTVKIPVIIDLGKVAFADKLTMVIFECLCYYVVSECRRLVFLKYNIDCNDIWTEGIYSSPLLILGQHDKGHVDKFVKKFSFDLYGNHFRKIIKVSDDELMLSKLMTDIDIFLKSIGVGEDYRDKIAEVIVELVGNAHEHTRTESLLDIDVTNSYTNNKTGEQVYGINLVVVNFSSQLFGSALKDKLHSEDPIKLWDSPRYNTLINAYRSHERQFNNQYTEEDFYNIASFQHKISGREGALLHGGTGLTKLINSLESMSDAHKCYMLTGTRIVNFISEHLVHDKENWISFNGNNDFKKSIPDANVINRCPIFFPGTAYNLNFVMKKEN